ncbi:hypothetical protein J6590_054354 [Homalodisca vitripennis]|nr:hypothetical protein J6590_054354 [Homalodisca vitripennis]
MSKHGVSRVAPLGICVMNAPDLQNWCKPLARALDPGFNLVLGSENSLLFPLIFQYQRQSLI